MDVASFLSKIEIRNTSKHGKGLFAVEDIRAGDTVFCEKAFAAVTTGDGSAKSADLCRRTPSAAGDRMKLFPHLGVALEKTLVDKVTRNKSTTSAIADLDCGDYTRSTVGEYDDVFLLERLVEKSLISALNQPKSSNGSKGLWIYASHMTYSCMQNTSKSSVGDLIVFRATRDFKSNEQLFYSHEELCDDFSEFQEHVKEVCNCAICIAERQTPPEQRATRQEVLALIAEFREEARKLSPEGPIQKAGRCLHEGARALTAPSRDVR